MSNISKIVKALMAGAVILASAVPATASPANSFSSPRSSEAILLSQSTTVRICTRDRGGRLNMRTGPGTGYPRVSQVPNGAVVSVLNTTDVPHGGYYWYQVSFRNRIGWVRGDFVC